MNIFDLIVESKFDNLISRCGYIPIFDNITHSSRTIEGSVLCNNYEYKLVWDEDGNCIGKPNKPFLYYYDLVYRENV